MKHKKIIIILITSLFSSALLSNDAARLVSIETKVDTIANDLQKIKNELISMNRAHETALDNIFKNVTSVALSMNKITGQKEPEKSIAQSISIPTLPTIQMQPPMPIPKAHPIK